MLNHSWPVFQDSFTTVTPYRGHTTWPLLTTNGRHLVRQAYVWIVLCIKHERMRRMPSLDKVLWPVTQGMSQCSFLFNNASAHNTHTTHFGIPCTISLWVCCENVPDSVSERSMDEWPLSEWAVNECVSVRVAARQACDRVSDLYCMNGLAWVCGCICVGGLHFSAWLWCEWT